MVLRGGLFSIPPLTVFSVRRSSSSSLDSPPMRPPPPPPTTSSASVLPLLRCGHSVYLMTPGHARTIPPSPRFSLSPDLLNLYSDCVSYVPAPPSSDAKLRTKKVGLSPPSIPPFVMQQVFPPPLPFLLAVMKNYATLQGSPPSSSSFCKTLFGRVDTRDKQCVWTAAMQKTGGSRTTFLLQRRIGRVKQASTKKMKE